MSPNPTPVHGSEQDAIPEDDEWERAIIELDELLSSWLIEA